MSRKNVLIAIGGRPRRRGCRRREPVLQEGQGPHRHDRRHQDARPRGDRLGVGQDSAEAPRQHQRRHVGPRRRISRSTKATASRRASSCCRSTRSRCAPASTAARASLQAAEASLDQLQQAIETARVQLDQAQQTLARQQDLWSAAADDARGARARRRTTSSRRSRRCRSARSRWPSQASRITQERADARERALRPQQGPDRVAHRRHRHAPQHPGGRNGGHRHDEQRRHGAADARRHVGDSGRSRGRRDQHPERAARAAGEDHDRRDPRPDVQGPRHRDRQQPDPGDRRRATGTQATNFKVVVIARRARCRTCGPGSPARRTSRPRRARTCVAVPIPAVAVRELVYDADGQVVKEPKTDKKRRAGRAAPAPTSAAS